MRLSPSPARPNALERIMVTTSPRTLNGPPKTSIWQRRLWGWRFLFQPLETIEARCRTYGDDYRVSQPDANPALNSRPIRPMRRGITVAPSERLRMRVTGIRNDARLTVPASTADAKT